MNQLDLGHRAWLLILAACLYRARRNRVRSESHALRANTLRHKLLAELGGKCALCNSRWQLAVDHVDGRQWVPSMSSQYIRVLRYWKEYRAGVRLRALCRKCNGGYNPCR